MSNPCIVKKEIDQLLKQQGDAIANVRNQIAVSQIYNKAINNEIITDSDKLVISSLLSSSMINSFNVNTKIHEIIDAFNKNEINKALSSSIVDPKYTKLNFNTLDGITENTAVEKMTEMFKQISGLEDNTKIQNINKKLEHRIKSLNKDLDTIDSNTDINEKDKEKNKLKIETQIENIKNRISGIDIIKSLISIPKIALNNTTMFPPVYAISKEFESDKTNNQQSKLSNNSKIVNKLKIESNTVVPDLKEDNKLANLTTLSILFGTTKINNAATEVNIPNFVKNVIKIESISAMDDVYKSLNDNTNDEDFDSKWGLDNTIDSYNADKDRAIYLNNQGIFPAAMIIQSLGASVYKGLPVKLSSNISNNLKNRAIVELGLYTLKYMENLNLISDVTFKGEFKALNTFTGKTQGLIQINHEISKDVISLSSALQYIDATEPRNTISHEPITYVDKKIRNSFIDKPKSVIKKILDMQSKKYKFSEDMSTVSKIYGDGKDEKQRDMAYAMAGIVDVPKDASIYEKISKLGDINYSKMQFDEMMHVYNEMQLTGSTDIYFPFDYTVSGRYMIDSILNPQESKITRFLITSDDLASHIDIKNGVLDPKQLIQYKNALAQAFDLDPDKHMDSTTRSQLEKIVKISNDGTVEFIEDYKNGTYYKVFNILKNIIDKDANDYMFKTENSTKYKEFINSMTNVNEIGAGFHVIQALMSLVKLSNAKQNGELTDGSIFNTAITLESDAITSGMILTLLQMGTKFSIDLASKGGIYTEEFTNMWIDILHTYNDIPDTNKIPILKDEYGKEKITHGLLKDLSKAISEKEGLISTIATTMNLNDETKLRFADFYETVAESSNAYMNQDEINIEKEIKDILKKETLTKQDSYNVKKLINKLSMIKFIDSINRSLAKPGVMIYIYGAMMSSIRKMLTASVVVPKIYKLLNNDTYKDTNVHTYITGINKSQSNENINGIAKYDYNEDVLKLMLQDINASDIQFKKYENGVISNILLESEKTFKNMIISEQMIKNLNNIVGDTLGDAFEEGFKPFKPIDDYRLSIKTLEIVRFSMFKYQYKRKLERLISSLGNNDGKYEVSTNDISNIIIELEKEGYGHSVNDINGGKQPLYKRDDIENSLRTAIHIKTENGFRSSRVDSKDFIINTGASGVITIHSIDGFIDSTSASMFNLIRIYDGSVSSINKLTEQAYEFNKQTSVATTWNTYNSQAKQISHNISDMIKHNEFNDMLETMSDTDKENLVNTLEKLMSYDDVEYITSDRINMISNGVKDSVKENMDYRTTDGSPTKISILNQYVTDASDPYVHKLNSKPSTVISDNDIDTIYNGFSKIISMLKTYKRNKRYGTESNEIIRRNVSFQDREKSIKDMLDHLDENKKDSGIQTIVLYPTTLKYDGHIDQGLINSKYQNNAIAVPVAINKKSINSTLNDNERKSIYEAIDLAFSLIPKDRDVTLTNSLVDPSIIKDVEIREYITKSINKLMSSSNPEAKYRNDISDAINTPTSGSKMQETTSNILEPSYYNKDVSVNDGANLYYEIKNGNNIQEFTDETDDIIPNKKASSIAKDVIANC